MDYSKDKKMYSENCCGHNPNDGENQTHFSGNTEGGRSATVVDSAGVGDGLSMVEGCEVENAESVSQGQRPMANRHTSGPFTVGT